jgi:hypothetical protein
MIIRSDKYFNKELEEKTNDIQEEFDRVMNEMINNRKKREGDKDSFYVVMD